MQRFPNAIVDFADAFVAAQENRHKADYDPEIRLTRSEVATDVENAETVIRAFGTCKIRDRRAFAAWVMFRNRG